MIGVEIDGQMADLPPTAKLELTLANPLFNDGNIIPGDYSLPFDLVAPKDSPTNAQLFNHPDVVESKSAFRKKDAKLFFDGRMIRKGKIWNRVFADKIQSNFVFGMATLGEDFKTKKLREVMDEAIVISSAAVNKIIHVAIGGGASAPYSIKVNGREYSGNTLVDIRNAINSDLTEPRASAVYNPTSTIFGGSTPTLEISPYTNPTDPLSPLHVDVDDNGTESVGYNWAVKSFDMAAYWASFNTFFNTYITITTPATDKFRVPWHLNYNLYGTEGAKTQDKINDDVNYSTTDLGGFRFNNPNGPVPFTVINQNSLQPFVMLKYVFEKIATYFSFTWDSDWLLDSDTQDMLIDNSMPLDVKQPYIGKTDFVFWRRSFNMNELVPDMTVVDFLKALQNRYNLTLRFDARSNKMRMMRRKPIAESTAKLSLDDVALGKPTIKDESLTGIRFESKQEKNDKYALPDYTEIGTPELTIKSDCSGMFGSGSNSQVQKKQPIKNTFELRVFHYVGMTFLSGTAYYPKAVVDAVNYYENWDDPTFGLYVKFWKHWAWQRLKRKVVEIELDWSIAELTLADLEKKYQYDRNDYFFKELKVDLSMKGFKPVKAELFTA